MQQQTEDRFRGRVFSAEFAFCMLTLAISSYTAGRVVDWGIDVRVVAVATGVAMLVPIGAWLVAGRAWRESKTG
jgi:hypothetical protein